MNALEKVAYIKGLMRGLGLSSDDQVTQVLEALVDVVDELAGSVAGLEDDTDEISAVIDEIDEDLGELEEEFLAQLGREEDEKNHHRHRHEPCGCGPHGHHHNPHPQEEEENIYEMDVDEPLYEVVCPTCGEVIYLDEDMLAEGEIICPSCKEHLEFGLDEEDTQPETDPSEGK